MILIKEIWFIRAGDGSVAFLAGGVPDLCLNRLVIHLNTPTVAILNKNCNYFKLWDKRQ